MKVNTIKLEPAFYDANAITYLSLLVLVRVFFPFRVMENWWWEIDKYNNSNNNKKFPAKKKWTENKCTECDEIFFCFIEDHYNIYISFRSIQFISSTMWTLHIYQNWYTIDDGKRNKFNVIKHRHNQTKRKINKNS